MEQAAEERFLQSPQNGKVEIEHDQKDTRCGFWKLHSKKLQL